MRVKSSGPVGVVLAAVSALVLGAPAVRAASYPAGGQVFGVDISSKHVLSLVSTPKGAVARLGLGRYARTLPLAARGRQVGDAHLGTDSRGRGVISFSQFVRGIVNSGTLRVYSLATGRARPLSTGKVTCTGMNPTLSRGTLVFTEFGGPDTPCPGGTYVVWAGGQPRAVPSGGEQLDFSGDTVLFALLGSAPDPEQGSSGQDSVIRLVHLGTGTTRTLVRAKDHTEAFSNPVLHGAYAYWLDRRSHTVTIERQRLTGGPKQILHVHGKPLALPTRVRSLGVSGRRVAYGNGNRLVTLDHATFAKR
jgi:hypothetical protein